jgi:hypothetical protein
MLRVATVVLALGACVATTGDEGMYVLNNTAVSGQSCTLNGTTSQPYLPRGEIYAQSPIAYLLTPLLESKLAAPAEGTDPTLKTIQLHSADIQLTVKSISIQHADGTFSSTQPNTMLPQFTSLFSGALPPGGSVNVAFDLIPPATIFDIVSSSGANLVTERLTAEVLAQVTVNGDLGGDHLSAAAFYYPVSICNDCVVKVVGTCPYTGTVLGGNPCNKWQDGELDCCVDATNRLVCPATM